MLSCPDRNRSLRSVSTLRARAIRGRIRFRVMLRSRAARARAAIRHVLVLDSGNCTLYEMYAAVPQPPGWHGGSGAVFNLASTALRSDYRTSADAAGLPIFPGLVRYDEVSAGVIRHALRFTVQTTQRAFIHPATHYASSTTSANAPPMGLRVRLKASFDLSTHRGASLVVLTALKRYGMIVADNGSDWFISGATDGRWDDNDLNQMKSVPASAFEVVQSGASSNNPGSQLVKEPVRLHQRAGRRGDLFAEPLRAPSGCREPRPSPGLRSQKAPSRSRLGAVPADRGAHSARRRRA